MSKEHIIASDLGSQSIKTAVFNIKGETLATHIQNTSLHVLGPGALVYDGNEFFRQTVNNIKISLQKSKLNPKDIVVLSFTGMGGGIIGVDDQWRPVCEFTNPLDNRDQSCFKDIMSKFGDLIRIRSGTGSPMGVNKIVWLQKKYPEIYRKTKKFMMVTQYVQGKLSGIGFRDAFWENTSASLSGLMDTEKYSWSEEICRVLNIDIDKLPRIVDTTEIIGVLTKKAANECGLVEGIPIVAGAYDKPCDQLGAGSNDIGLIVDNAATYPAITVCVDNFTSDTFYKTLECTPSAEHGKWIVMTYITGGGLTHRWFVDTFCEEYIKSARKNKANPYSLLDKDASHISPGSNGLIFIPHLSGRATPNNPDVRGLWIGFGWTHKRPHFYRAILEAIAYDHACSLRVVKKLYPHIKLTSIRVLGGGAVSNLWNQIKADVIGLPYDRLSRDDTTILGAAIIGGKAVGLFKDMHETALSFLQIRERIYPKHDLHDFYKKYVDTYESMYSDLEKTFNRIVKLSD